MGTALSRDLRVRVIDAVEGGMSRRAAAARFGVGYSSAIRWVSDWKRTGRTEARRRGGDRLSHRIAAHAEFLKAKIGEVPDITLDELRYALLSERGEAFGDSSISRFFQRHKLSCKKDRARAGAGPRRRSRKAPRLVDAQPDLDPERLYFIDGEAQAPSVRAQRRTVSRPRWRGAMEERRRANAVGHRCRTATG
jgi:transposase